jgi:phosphoserine/homoserine phosphotransferase
VPDFLPARIILPGVAVWVRHSSFDIGPLPVVPFAPMKQSVVTLDMEGVLTPEIWIAVAEKTGIPELRRTTRDEPDYDKLMQGRLAILDRHGIKLSDIQAVIGTLPPLPGVLEFLRELRTLSQVIILSDTFEQFAQPLIRQLEWPTLFCHRLVVENDRITGYKLRMADQKRQSVRALQLLNYKVLAAGDSYNDTTMLLQADHGFLFHAPENVRREFPQFPAFDDYGALLSAMKAKL